MKRCGEIAAIALLILAGLGPRAAAQEAGGFVFETPAGEPLALSDYSGRPVLIAVTDPYCGFTNQYPDLQRLWERYRDRGLVVLGLPTDAFITRQSVDTEEFARYCREMIGISFPLAGTVAVRGEGAHPFFAWLREQAGPAAVPRLPFYRYLIGPEGDLRAWFPPSVAPMEEGLLAAIERALDGIEAEASALVAEK